MKKLGAFSKPLTVAIDLHDEMDYGAPEPLAYQIKRNTQEKVWRALS